MRKKVKRRRIKKLSEKEKGESQRMKRKRGTGEKTRRDERKIKEKV